MNVDAPIETPSRPAEAPSVENDVFINEYQTHRWPWPGCPVLVLMSDGRTLRASHTGGSWKVYRHPRRYEGYNGQPWLRGQLHVVGWKLDPDRPAHIDTIVAYAQGYAMHMYQKLKDLEVAPKC